MNGSKKYCAFVLIIFSVCPLFMSGMFKKRESGDTERIEVKAYLNKFLHSSSIASKDTWVLLDEINTYIEDMYKKESVFTSIFMPMFIQVMGRKMQQKGVRPEMLRKYEAIVEYIQNNYTTYSQGSAQSDQLKSLEALRQSIHEELLKKRGLPPIPSKEKAEVEIPKKPTQKPPLTPFEQFSSRVKGKKITPTLKQSLNRAKSTSSTKKIKKETIDQRRLKKALKLQSHIKVAHIPGFYESKSNKELKVLINLSKVTLKSKKLITYYSLELKKSEPEIKKLLNEIINNAQQAFEKKTPSKATSPSSHPQSKKPLEAKEKKLAPASKQPEAKAKSTISTQKEKGKEKLDESQREKLVIKRFKPEEPLWQLAEKGNIELLKEYLHKGADLNKTSPGGETPVSLAAHNGHRDIVQLLIDAGANMNKSNINGHTPLMFAIFRKHFDIAHDLIKAGADVNARSNRGRTALQEAAMNGYEDIVHALVEAGADTSTAISEARMMGHRAIAKFLAQNNQKERPKKFIKQKGKKVPSISLWHAAREGDLNILNWYLNDKTNINKPNENGETPLIIAADNNREKIVKRLLEAKANLDLQDHAGDTALLKALKRNHLSMTDQLLQAGANIKIKNNDGINALREAVRQGHPLLIEKLIAEGADPNEAGIDGYTVLMLATYLYHYNKEIIPLLISAGAEVNAQDDFGITALMIAANRGYCQTKKLLEAGASISFMDITGKTALDYARSESTIDLLKKAEFQRKISRKKPSKPIISRKKAIPETKVISTETINSQLFKTAKKGNIKQIRKLLNSGADANAQNDRGESVLTVIARWNPNPIPAAQILLDLGANIDEVAEIKGMPPLHSAVINGNIGFVKFLLDQGAQVNSRESYRGRTPLHWVVRMTEDGGRRKMIKQYSIEHAKELLELLLSRGADPSIRDKKKLTPFRFARVLGLSPLAKILKAASGTSKKLAYNTIHQYWNQCSYSSGLAYA